MNYKTTISVLLTIALLLQGCMGHSANPVSIKQRGDTDMTCDELTVEAESTEEAGRRLKRVCDGKLPYNVAMGVAGAFVLVPWFFMDAKCGECEEYRALLNRASYLESLAYVKCKEVTGGNNGTN
jgi:hypothetical protein